MVSGGEGIPGEEPERKAADTLQRSEELFRLLVDSVMEYAIFVLDCEGRVATWNAGAQRLKGYRADEIIGQHFSRFYPPEVSRALIHEELALALRDGQFRDEGWRVRKDGTRFWADVTITPVRDNRGDVRGFAKVTCDMTARKLADEEREKRLREQARREEAEHANRMKDAFLATLSHELRTPLNAIVGWSHMLETQDLPPSARKAVAVIRRNADAQTQLISDILDIARISAGKIQLQMQRVEMEKVVQAAVDAVSPAAAVKHIPIARLTTGEIAAVSGDPDRLQQVVWNLLTNAVKFTPREGKIEVRLEVRGAFVELVVKDSGAGIAAEFVPHVFEPFRQADGSAARSYGGLGLGLTIVRHIVDLHGGTVSVESAGSGQGACFVVQLPTMSRSPGPNAAAPSSEVNPTRLFGLHILVVEDDDDSRALACAMLERFGARVTSVRSAAEGIKVLERERPDVLIADIQMPDETGYDFIRSVRALTPDRGGLIPAIALTSFARPEDRIRALTTGFQLHLTKPTLPEDLAAAVAAVTARTRAM